MDEVSSFLASLEYPISGGRSLPRGYKAKFWTDHKTFVVCAIFRVEKVVKNGNGKVKFVKLSDQPVAFGVSEVNLDAGDKFDVIGGKYVPGLGRHIAKQRAINAIPKENWYSATSPYAGILISTGEKGS